MLRRSCASARPCRGRCLFGSAASAADKPTIDTGDTAWLLVATALGLMMNIRGLALFYAGMVRKKNVLATPCRPSPSRRW